MGHGGKRNPLWHAPPGEHVPQVGCSRCAARCTNKPGGAPGGL